MQLKHRMVSAAIIIAVTAGPFGLSAANRPAPARHGSPGQTQGLMAACDPFSEPWWDWDDEDIAAGGAALHGSSRDAAASVIGTTPEAIHHNFTNVITRNLANAGTASRVARLSDKELAAIARIVERDSPSARAGLLELFATRLDGAGLVRIAKAFGREPVEAAVRAHAAPDVRAAFERGVMGLAAGPGQGGGGGGGGTPHPSPSPPRPTVDMTLEEIYLEYRTAPVGSLSRAGALAETAQFAGVHLAGAAWAGQLIGTGISWLIQTYAPELDDAIGGTIGGMIDNFWSASGELQEGHFEAAFDSLFGFPVTYGSDPYGDWDISAPMMFYYQSTSTCGW